VAWGCLSKADFGAEGVRRTRVMSLAPSSRASDPLQWGRQEQINSSAAPARRDMSGNRNTKAAGPNRAASRKAVVPSRAVGLNRAMGPNRVTDHKAPRPGHQDWGDRQKATYRERGCRGRTCTGHT
jgi:hypothetical protein